MRDLNKRKDTWGGLRRGMRMAPLEVLPLVVPGLSLERACWDLLRRRTGCRRGVQSLHVDSAASASALLDGSREQLRSLMGSVSRQGNTCVPEHRSVCETLGQSESSCSMATRACGGVPMASRRGSDTVVLQTFSRHRLASVSTGRRLRRLRVLCRAVKSIRTTVSEGRARGRRWGGWGADGPRYIQARNGWVASQARYAF